MGDDDYLTVNRAGWDERAPVHASSPDYALERLVADPTAISDVVRFDQPRLGDLTGVRGVHLQCHLGTDTLSLARLGATMTGLDFSPASLEQARTLVARSGDGVDFVEGDVYRAPELLGEGDFDLVYTGIGALCWLPSIDRWAEVVSRLLRPGGRLFVRDGHPMMWTLEHEIVPGRLVVEHTYVERDEPTIFEDEGTYVATDAEIRTNRLHEWNHGIGETITALIAHGLQITALDEHDSVPWDRFPGLMKPHPDHPGGMRLADRPWRVPHTFTLQATRA